MWQVAIILLYLYNMENKGQIRYRDAGSVIFHTSAGKSEAMERLVGQLSSPTGNVSRISDNELMLDFSSGLSVRRILCTLVDDNGGYRVELRFCRHLTIAGKFFSLFLCLAAAYFIRSSLTGGHPIGIIIALVAIGIILLGIASYYAFGFGKPSCKVLGKKIVKIEL